MTLLLLAGTGEARRIAQGLAEAGVEAVASLAGVTARPAALALPTRVGGFGGEAGFRDYLAAEGIGAVLDATHPYAARISARTARLCREAGLPYCRYERPAWEMEPGWALFFDEADAVRLVPEGACVFLATGRQTLARFAGLKGRIYARVVDAPGEAFPFQGEWIVGRPGSIDAEEALFRRLGVDWLIVKNSGGDAGRAKLEAARRLGIAVGVIARPAPAEGLVVESIAAAVGWAKALAGGEAPARGPGREGLR